VDAVRAGGVVAIGYAAKPLLPKLLSKLSCYPVSFSLGVSRRFRAVLGKIKRNSTLPNTLIRTMTCAAAVRVRCLIQAVAPYLQTLRTLGGQDSVLLALTIGSAVGEFLKTCPQFRVRSSQAVFGDRDPLTTMLSQLFDRADDLAGEAVVYYRPAN